VSLDPLDSLPPLPAEYHWRVSWVAREVRIEFCTAVYGDGGEIETFIWKTHARLEFEAFRGLSPKYRTDCLLNFCYQVFGEKHYKRQCPLVTTTVRTARI
jgi:hypothetical protein